MDTVIANLTQSIKTTIESFREEIMGIRAGRPNAGLVEDIKVQYYGQSTPIKHLGSVGIQPPREISIQVWDMGAVTAVAKAIETSPLGVSATIDGNSIRIFLPELSEERRAELIKVVKKISEQYRIQIRHIRDEANKSAEKVFEDESIGEDAYFRIREDIQKLIDGANDQIEKEVNLKIGEIQE